MELLLETSESPFRNAFQVFAAFSHFSKAIFVFLENNNWRFLRTFMKNFKWSFLVFTSEFFELKLFTFGANFKFINNQIFPFTVISAQGVKSQVLTHFLPRL